MEPRGIYGSFINYWPFQISWGHPSRKFFKKFLRRSSSFAPAAIPLHKVFLQNPPFKRVMLLSTESPKKGSTIISIVHTFQVGNNQIQPDNVCVFCLQNGWHFEVLEADIKKCHMRYWNSFDPNVVKSLVCCIKRHWIPVASVQQKNCETGLVTHENERQHKLQKRWTHRQLLSVAWVWEKPKDWWLWQSISGFCVQFFASHRDGDSLRSDHQFWVNPEW